MSANEIDIPVVRRHFSNRATGEAEIEAGINGTVYRQQWIYAEDDDYLDILRSNGSWRRIAPHAVLRPGGTVSEVLIADVNDNIGINTTPDTEWDPTANVIQFEEGTGAYAGSVTSINGSMYLCHNLRYDDTDNRWERGGNSWANMVMMTASNVQLYAFATGAADSLADTAATSTNALTVSSGIGTFVNHNEGDHNFSVNYNGGGGTPAFYVDGGTANIGIRDFPDAEWDPSAYVIQFGEGAGTYGGSLVSINGSMYLSQNLRYDDTDNRWERGGNSWANMVMMTASNIQLYAFATGAADSAADTAAVTTNSLTVSSAVGTLINSNAGDHDFSVNYSGGSVPSIFVEGSTGLVGSLTVTPFLAVGGATGDFYSAGVTYGMHLKSDTDVGDQIYMILEGVGDAANGASGLNGCHLVFATRNGAANLKMCEWVSGGGLSIFRALNDDTTVKTADILVLDYDAGNVGIGTQTIQAACVNNLAIKEGTAPGGATADQGYIWAQDDGGTAEVYVQDGAGNQLKISPHSQVGEWEFQCKNVKTGRVLNIQMEQLVKFLDKKFGTKFLTESQPL
ncbi:MAG: hypothetical protein GY853_13850 [PVC group bacterium]|nr:hypothetical protein [PVC group bacterium]